MDRREFFLGAGALGLGACAPVRARPPARDLVIDVHCHAGRGKNYGKPVGPGVPRWTVFHDYNDVLRGMARAGIDRSVIFPIENVTYEKANEEIARIVARHPDKLIGFAKHSQETEEGRIRRLLTREVRALGLRGLKLHGTPTPEILEVVEELRIPILFHPGRVADIYESVVAYPQINFILAHLGSYLSKLPEDHAAALAAVKSYPNLYVETSGVRQIQFLEQAARELPAHKLLFGTDAPGPDGKDELRRIRRLGLSAERERLVLGGNARRLLGI